MNTFVPIYLLEAEAFADYTGIEYDLSSARDFARSLLDSIRNGNYELSEPMTIAILVRYARPFMSGLRLKIGKEALSVLTPDQRAKHRDIIAMRNLHIAHSVSGFEENQPVARYWMERVKEDGIEQITCTQNRVVGLGIRNLEDLIEIATVLLQHVKGILKAEQEKILKLVRSMPLDDVLSGGRKPKLATDPKKHRRQTQRRAPRRADARGN
jgi:hypothetical protein